MLNGGLSQANVRQSKRASIAIRQALAGRLRARTLRVLSPAVGYAEKVRPQFLSLRH